MMLSIKQEIGFFSLIQFELVTIILSFSILIVLPEAGIFSTKV